MYVPKISIIIPAYNASDYLSEAIDSALNQTYSNIEIIVVNDGSKDDGATEKIALSYGQKIRYLSKENGGSSSALNWGISHMTGEWFSWLSHDDLYVPEKLQKQWEYMQALNVPVADLPKHVFFSASDLIDAKGRTIRSARIKQARKLSRKIDAFPHNGYLIAEPTVYNFHGCSCLIHRNAFQSIGGFDENLRLINDLDMWYRLYAANYKLHFIPETLVKGRIHAKQVSKSIGYSYHNAEQDMFWARSLNWLQTNHPNDDRLLCLFGKNALLKTRYIEADLALDQINKHRIRLLLLRNIWKMWSLIRNAAKKIYIKLNRL